ncbi:YCF48-related protein [Catalinimonas sp. 4WD22]|uniref:WD40/YVTN/BNR-like repeat-containing protein n=1 Tax=Catalinimonas locisalis TaxID=3133978 RepID=UPI003100C794
MHTHDGIFKIRHLLLCLSLLFTSCEFEEINLEKFDLLRKLVDDEWIVQATGTDYPIRDMFFLDSQRGWVLAYETLIHTKNGGDSWERLPLPVFVPGGNIYFSDASNGWISAIDQGLLKTVDGGSTWSSISLNTFIDRLYPLDAQRAWIATIDKTILKTEDGWETWKEYEFDVASTSFLQFVNPETGWALGFDSNGSFIRKTMDGGQTWVNQNFNQQGTLTEIQFQGGFFFDENTGWLIGYVIGREYANYILKTADGGQTWSTQLLGINSYPPLAQDIYFLDSQTGYIIGNEDEQGVIFSTSDGGENWSKEEIFTDKELCCLFVSDEEEIWVAGDEGLILYKSGK